MVVDKVNEVVGTDVDEIDKAIRDLEIQLKLKRMHNFLKEIEEEKLKVNKLLIKPVVG